MHAFQHVKEHTFLLCCSPLPVSLPLSLCLLTGLRPNLLCSLQFHLKSFTSLNTILHLSLCLSSSSSHPSYTASFLLSPLSTSSLFSHVPPNDSCLTSLIFYPSLLLFFFSPPHFVCLSTDCQFEISGWDGIIHSSQVEEEERVKPGDALDCIWTIRAPPQSKVSTRDHISHLK